jgi:hypothetical protein
MANGRRGELWPDRLESPSWRLPFIDNPLMSEQKTLLRHDLTWIGEKLQDICILMRVCDGVDGSPTIRADETAANCR